MVLYLHYKFPGILIFSHFIHHYQSIYKDPVIPSTWELKRIKMKFQKYTSQAHTGEIFKIAATIIFLFEIVVVTRTEDTRGFCSFKFGKGEIDFKNELIEFKGNNGESIYINLCESLMSGVPGCEENSSACIKKAGKGIHSSRNGKFVGEKAKRRDPFLKYTGRDKCETNPNKTYSIIINLRCEEIEVVPRITSWDERNCSYVLDLMKPFCDRISCLIWSRDKNPIDLRKMTEPITFKYGGNNLQVPVCGNKSATAFKCDNETDCDVFAIDKDLEAKQMVLFNENANSLSVTTKFTRGKSKIRFFELLIECDWKETDITPVRVESKSTLHYKFYARSKIGCIKLEQNCIVTGSLSSYTYDLTGLYNKEGFWKVRNTSNTEMVVNICGPLNTATVNQNYCSDLESQICERDLNNKFINRGSIFLPFEETDTTLQLTIIAGDVCVENSSVTYQTIVHFSCSSEEEGPSVWKYDTCQTIIKWSTPHACPFRVEEGSDCEVTDSLGKRNLRNLSTGADFVAEIGPKLRLAYSVCRGLQSPCGSDKGVAACLIGPEKETVIGWRSDKIISRKGHLKQELQGDFCDVTRNVRASCSINFICSFTRQDHEVKVVHDNCVFNITIYSPFACSKQSSQGDCRRCKDSICYDLSGLAKTGSNYLIRDESDPKIEYVLNVCTTVFTEPDLLCLNSMACVRNNHEVDFRRRYTSLGNYKSIDILQNDSVQIKSGVGSSCGSDYYESLINFKCSTREEAPYLSSKENCRYIFQWNTKYACNEAKYCLYNDQKNNKNFDFSFIQKRTFNLKYGVTNYIIDLCGNEYEECQNGTCVLSRLKRSLKIGTQGYYADMVLNTKCSPDVPLSRVSLHLVCDELVNNDHFTQVYFDNNCTIKVYYKTNAVCDSDKITSQLAWHMTTLDQQGDLRNDPKVKAPEAINLYCSVEDPRTKRSYDVAPIQPVIVEISEKRYEINWNLIPEKGQKCTNVAVSDTGIGVSFDSDIICQVDRHYEIDIEFKCHEITAATSQATTDEASCKILLQFTSSDYCFQPSNGLSAAGITGISICVVVILVMSAVSVYYYLKKRRFFGVRDKSRVAVYYKSCD